MTVEEKGPLEEIRTLYEDTRVEIRALIGSVSPDAWRRQSRNPGWTNGEILVHIAFGFMILNTLLPLAQFFGRLPKGRSRSFAKFLNFLLRPFNWINAIGARGQARVIGFKRVGRFFDWAMRSLLSKLDRIRDDEWQKGMHYPTFWDPNFRDFMTLEKLFRYPVEHYRLHRGQIAL